MQNQNICDNICPNDGAMTAAVYDELARRLVPYIVPHLENCTNDNGNVPSQKGDGPDMSTKINRTVVINGVKRWIHANTEQEYADKLIKLYSGETTPTAHDFRSYALNWFDVYSRPTVATVTARTYKRQLTKYLIPHFDGIPVENICVDDIQRLFNGMDCKKATKDKVKTVLNMILNSAVEDGLLAKNPMKSSRLKITGKASKTTDVYSVEEMQYIANHIHDVQSPVDRAYIALQALHPLRLEEVLGLKWEDIDTENMVIHVRRAVTHPDRNQPEIKETKTDGSVRDIALSSVALGYLSPCNPSDFVIGGDKALSCIQVRRMCARIAKDMKFDGKITPIRFRTTVLTDIYDKTKDIKLTKEAAGHRTENMTLKYYVKGRDNGSATTAAVIDATYCVPAV